MVANRQQLHAEPFISQGQAAYLCLKSVVGIKRPIAHIEWGIAARVVDYFFALLALAAFTAEPDFGVGVFSTGWTNPIGRLTGLVSA